MTLVESKEIIGFCGLTTAAGFYGGWVRDELQSRRTLRLWAATTGFLITLVLLGLFSVTRVESWRDAIPIRHPTLAPLLALAPVVLVSGLLGWAILVLRRADGLVRWLRSSWPFVLIPFAVAAVIGAPAFAEVRNPPLRLLMQSFALGALAVGALRIRRWWTARAALPAEVPGSPAAPVARLAVRGREGIVLLALEEITSVQVENGLVFVTTCQGRFWTKHTTLSEVAPSLASRGFERVHRSAFVSLSSVRQVVRRRNHTACLTLACGAQVCASRSRMRALRARLSL